MLHILFIYKNKSTRVPFYIKFHGFVDFVSNFFNHTDWISQSINAQVFMNNFNVIDDIKEIDRPSILLIDKAHIFTLNMEIFDFLTIGEKIIKSGSLESYYNYVFLDNYFFPQNILQLENEKRYSLDLDDKETTITLKNGLNDISESSLYFSGNIINTDKFTPTGINICFDELNTPFLTQLFKREIYFYHDECYYFPSYRFKITKTNENSLKLIRH